MSPSFNAEHYQQLMDGLEISEVRLNEIDHRLLRIEAEYYKKKYLKLEKKVSGFNALGELCNKIVCGPFGSNLLDTLYQESGILVVRPFNIKNFGVSKNNLVYVSESAIRENNLKVFTKGTLLFSRVGDIKIGLLNRESATISPNVIAAEVRPGYGAFLTAFFHTPYGYDQIRRELKVLAQPTISTQIIKTLKVPNFSSKFRETVNKLVECSESLAQKAESEYHKAQSIFKNEFFLP